MSNKYKIHNKKDKANKTVMNGTYYRSIHPDAKEILKNKSNGKFDKFIEICKLSQKDLKKYLENELKKFGYNTINEDGFLYANGDIPILLTAHMDTVHKKPVKKYFVITTKDNKHIITSPQGIGGDDRCGIYMILKILEAGFRPYVLFCEDEEVGGIGSDKFVKTKYIDELKNLKYMIELDRANQNDAVFYDCDNDEFTKYITKETGYEETWGTFSDISTLAPAAEIAAVNLSCGYYNAHTLIEEVVYEEMMETEKIVEKLLSSIDDCKQFEYIEGYNSYYYSHISYSKSHDSNENINSTYTREVFVDDYSYDAEYEGVLLHVLFEDENGGATEEYIYAETEGDAWRDFFIKNQFICFAQVLDYEYDRF